MPTQSPNLSIVDAFTDRPFNGNPAAVCILPAPADAGWMQLVAREMNLSETAFLSAVEGGFDLRWFTPAMEISLCGHATLASAHVLWEKGILARDQAASFRTKSGWLTCRYCEDWIEMDLPAQQTTVIEMSFALAEALGTMPVFAGSASPNWLVEAANEQLLRDLAPDFRLLAKLPVQGIIVTARSQSPEFDFVSRYFSPATGLNEDPVTGSAHCALGPYWQKKLGKSAFTAFQASARGGVVRVDVRGERVTVSGKAVTTGRVELVHF